MTNENLKVGSCVSWLNSYGWSYDKVQSEYELREFTKQVVGTYEWIFGMHPSLVPEGFVLVNELDSLREFYERDQLIKSQQSRIELLESAIREFNAADKATDHAEDGCALGDINIDYFKRKWKAEETLRNLMENKS